MPDSDSDDAEGAHGLIQVCGVLAGTAATLPSETTASLGGDLHAPGQTAVARCTRAAEMQDPVPRLHADPVSASDRLLV